MPVWLIILSKPSGLASLHLSILFCFPDCWSLGTGTCPLRSRKTLKGEGRGCGVGRPSQPAFAHVQLETPLSSSFDVFLFPLTA